MVKRKMGAKQVKIYFLCVLCLVTVSTSFANQQDNIRDGGTSAALVRFISSVEANPDDLTDIVTDVFEKEATTPKSTNSKKGKGEASEDFSFYFPDDVTLHAEEDSDSNREHIFGPKGFFVPDWPLGFAHPQYPSKLQPQKPSVLTVTPRPVYGVITDIQTQQEAVPAGLSPLENISFLGATTFVNLVEKSGLSEMLFSNKGTFTVFAPTEFAFGKLILQDPKEYNNVLLKNQTLLTSILLQHIVPRKLMLDDLIPGDRIPTLAKNRIEISDIGGLKFGGAKIIPNMSNQNSGKGVIHLIDTVLYPLVLSNETRPEKNPSKNQTTTKPLLDESSLTIQAPFGSARGLFLRKEIRAWLGIPFAKPPLGPLRFSKPQPHPPLEGILEATRLPNACMQSKDEFFGNFSGSQKWNPNTEISEDCLYLNVYAPLLVQELLPVIVWIYGGGGGGGFSTGSSSLPIYDPSILVKSGNVVFVSMQYRLGAYGFLFMGKNLGNAGLQDQALALQWVQDNIEFFGGDPSQVTLMGESAGAASVSLHMMSPGSGKLFHRAILQSAGSAPKWGIISAQESLKRTEKFSNHLNCDFSLLYPETTLECLQNKSSIEILAAQEKMIQPETLNVFSLFVPTIDGSFLTDDPNVLLERGKIKNISVIIGNNANEGIRSLMYSLPEVFPNFELTLPERTLSDEEFQKSVQRIFTSYPKVLQQLISYEYRRKFPGPDRFFRALDQMVGDSDYVCNVESLAERLALNGNKVYRYYYNHHSSTDPWPSWSGSKHGDELEYVFGRPLKNPKLYTPDEITFAEDIVSLWTNFASTGSPNPSTFQTMWPEYTSPAWKYLKLSADYQGLEGYRQFYEQCQFWNHVMPEFLPPKVEKNFKIKSCQLK